MTVLGVTPGHGRVLSVFHLLTDLRTSLNPWTLLLRRIKYIRTTTQWTNGYDDLLPYSFLSQTRFLFPSHKMTRRRNLLRRINQDRSRNLSNLTW